MICDDPFVKGNGEAFPCGKCFACLKRWRELWTHRLMLEKLCHSDSAFVTLTYADDTIPENMSLQPVHLQDWLKRLREHWWRKVGKGIRFYGVGEYSDVGRPHYHVLLFGVPSCQFASTQYRSDGSVACCDVCNLVRDTWGYGRIHVGTVTHQSVRYVCSYMTKNMRHRHDSRLQGREPEFSRKSTRPGIGYPALREVTETILAYGLDKTEVGAGKVPTHLRHAAIKRPLGRYLRGKIADMLQMDKACVDEEVQALWQSAVVATPMGGEARRTLFKNMLIDAADQRIVNMKARFKIRAKREKL